MAIHFKKAVPRIRKVVLKPPRTMIIPSLIVPPPPPPGNNFDSPRDAFFHAKLLLVLLLCLRYPIDRDAQEWGRLERYYHLDLEFCPECFIPKSEMCYYFSENFQFVFHDVVDVINSLLGVKSVMYGRLKGMKGKVVAKYAGREPLFGNIRRELGVSSSEQELEARLWRSFVRQTREGFYFCRAANLDLFVDRLTVYTSSRFETWMHLLIDIEAILLAALNEQNHIPTPKYYGHCGFTVYESYDGLTLSQWDSDKLAYVRKLKIGLQILQAAVALSDGFEDYRIFLTDLTLDNVVYNYKTGNISLIDLDSVIIVDSFYNRTRRMTRKPPPFWHTIFKYEKLDCEGCFAYQRNDFCKHHLNDVNIFAACQLLNEDLYGNETKGYLKPLPSFINTEFPNLERKLRECVHCPASNCSNRFGVSTELIEIFQTVIAFIEVQN